MKNTLHTLPLSLSLFAAASVLACAPAADSPATSGSSELSKGNNGEFIIRVLPTGQVARVDPIMAPGVVAPHTHVFFGAENVTPTATPTELEAQPTVAKDTKDTAAYWVPQLWFKGKPWNPGCTGTPPNLICGTDPNTTYYVRAYYTTTVGPSTVQLPRLSMVTGYPTANADPHLTDPTSMSRVYYTCGATPTIVTPNSAWPYSCDKFSDPAFDGVVMILDFPDCWNGAVSGNMNGERVVQYVDPNVKGAVNNDLAYRMSNDTCPAKFPLHIPRVSLRVHSFIQNPSSDNSTIWPSSCIGSTFTNCQTQGEPPASGPGSEGLQLSSDAATPGGWYTFHGDYVQSWHMGTVTSLFSTSPPPNQDTAEMPGTLNDLTEDCLLAAKTCGFQPGGAGQFVGN